MSEIIQKRRRSIAICPVPEKSQRQEESFSLTSREMYARNVNRLLSSCCFVIIRVIFSI